MIRNLCLFALIVSLSNCGSVEKYNKQISNLHSVEEIHEDIDYAYHKLQKLHPDLYWYTSKDSLDKKISDLKENIKKPISSIEFYKQLAPVVSNVKQGHLSIYTPQRRQTKAEIKEKGKRSYPFKPLAFKGIDDRLYIKENYGKDSTGSLVADVEVLSIENEKVSDLLTNFKKLQASDGYNTTYIPEYVVARFGALYTYTHKQKDSILLKLKKEDSIYSYYISANYNKKNESPIKNVTSVTGAKEISKADKKEEKAKRKKIIKEQYKHGYNKYTKKNNRDFSFITPNESGSIAYMKIRSFTKGVYKDFYKESFTKIDSSQCKHLVIDLRGNYGGRLAEIDELYSYLTDKEYIFLEESKMTKRLSFLYPYFHSRSWLKKSAVVAFSPLIATYQLFKVKRSKGDPYFKFKYNKLRKPKPNSYKGKIYVLINGESFSASSILSTHLKATKRATFIGQETGGAYNGTVAGFFTGIELPNSKIKMRVGLLKINTPHTMEPDGYGIKPDVIITKELSDKDQELDWVINHVKKSS
ncbi:S41 family peptidase [Aquimarina sp. MMG016]|uniref:S41 family peptidase n=1 Tax=Aquimarina sp. MMG016 TaxID=2822690 RepID=UPI001B39F892|nr:S41 family peptidase [Aquimarina sp. MMG016]MBQ4818448.1 S41 family peptidase [Aquimarina sp. MMG016]